MRSLFLIIFVFFQSAAFLGATSEIPYELRDVAIKDKVGEKIDLQSKFTNEKGEQQALSDFFHQDKPVILALVYYSCPNLCNFLLNGLTDVLKKLQWQPGREFEIVAVSIDPSETSGLAKAKKENYLKLFDASPSLDRMGLGGGWHFLVSPDNQVQSLSSQVGFGYRYDEKQKQYAHAAGLFILTPEGVLSRTLFGIQFEPQDLKLALLEAAQGKIGNFVDRLLLFCYHYDPEGKRYSLYALNLMKLGGFLTLVVLIVFLIIMCKRKDCCG
ncbi:MAG: SCO family protein [Deltaproteobacteria bacterium]|nr:SCO family protein [Deltaproteobacteria bacterium]